MTAFPDAIPPSVPYAWAPSFLTKIGGPYETPVLDARIVWPLPVLKATLKWPKRTTPSSDYVALYDFFIACRGRAIPFTFFDFNDWKRSPVGMQWNHVYIATRDGVTNVYDLPGKDMTSIQIYNSAAPTTPLTLTTDYTIASGAGTDGKDQITFVGAYAPGTAGHTVNVSFVGRLGISAHFTADEMPFETFHVSVQASGMQIEQVYP